MIVTIVDHKEEAFFEALEKAFAGFGSVSVRRLEESQRVPRVPGLDAIWLTPPYAEKWGSKPLLHKAQILKTSEEEQVSGIPRYIIAGVSTTADEAKDRLSQLQFTLRIILEKIADFNAGSTKPIRTLGMWSFYLRNLDPSEVASIVKKLYAGGKAGSTYPVARTAVFAVRGFSLGFRAESQLQDLAHSERPQRNA